MPPNPRVEPFTSWLHFIPRTLGPVQAAIVNSQRKYFSRAPGWVLLTTTGRRTGLPRETLLPCGRSGNQIFLISTYGWRSDWIRNLLKNPEVKVTSNGAVISGHAEVIEDVDEKRRIVSEHPFFAPAPFELVQAVALNPAVRPILVAFLRRWVTSHPVVVVHIRKRTHS